MWAHMMLVASILVSNDFMYQVTKLLEGSFIFEDGNPLLVSIAALVIFVIFIVHAALGMRKLPGNFKQYQVIKAHSKSMDMMIRNYGLHRHLQDLQCSS